MSCISSLTASRAMQSHGGNICPCNCIAQILPKGWELVKIVCHRAHDVHHKNCISVACSHRPSPSSNLVCFPHPLARLFSQHHLKACGACVAKGGHGGYCRPQHDITLCNAKKYDNPFNSHITPPSPETAVH
jgi:hypothetical protein